jgi:hypothetical protein
VKRIFLILAILIVTGCTKNTLHNDIYELDTVVLNNTLVHVDIPVYARLHFENESTLTDETRLTLCRIANKLKYKSYTRLNISGCNADIVYDYLVSHHHIPTDKIVYRFNEYDNWYLNVCEISEEG